jgi:hypothetical protein
MIPSKTLLVAIVTLGATSVAACSSGSEPGSDPVPARTTAATLTACGPGEPAFSLSTAPRSQSADFVNGQATLSFAVTLTQTCGTANTATLRAALPFGVEGNVTFDPPSVSTDGGTTTATFVLPPTATTAQLVVIQAQVALDASGPSASDTGWVQSHYPISTCSKPPCLCQTGYHLCNGVCVPQSQGCAGGPWMNVGFDH